MTTTDTTTQPMPAPFTATPDDMMRTVFGVHVTSVGEDGNWLALDHVEPRRMLAAVLRAARDEIGLTREETIGPDDTWGDASPLDCVVHSWAVFERHPDGCQCRSEHDLPGCLTEPDVWWCRFGGVTEGTPGAVPVTMWKAPW